MGQAITVAVGPLVTASATNIAGTQAGKANKPFVLNGAIGNAVATAVSAVQTAGGAGNLLINGTFASGGIAQLGSPHNIYVTSSGNDSARTFTITGTAWNAMGLYGVVEAIAGSNAGVSATVNKFATVTQIAIDGAAAANVSAGKFTMATLDTPRRVLITPGSDETGKVFVLTGTDYAGNTISENLAGTNATAFPSLLDYKTVTSIVPTTATAGTLTVGTNGVAGSRWVRFDDYAGMAEVTIQATVSGTANYSIQQTMQDPNALPAGPWGDGNGAISDEGVTWFSHPTAALVAASSSQQGYYGTGTLPVPVFARVLLNSGSGSVSTIFRQVYTG